MTRAAAEAAESLHISAPGGELARGGDPLMSLEVEVGARRPRRRDLPVRTATEEDGDPAEAERAEVEALARETGEWGAGFYR